jgi:hypothetical protein
MSWTKAELDVSRNGPREGSGGEGCARQLSLNPPLANAVERPKTFFH